MPTHPEQGLSYWRSLEQLADSPQVQQQIAEEFPGYDPKGLLALSRRKFVKLMAASMALAGIGLNGCRRWPKEKLAPYVSKPTDRIEGMSEYYATAFELDGVAMGVLAESFDGRPIKIDGNPSHPFARTFEGKLGAASPMQQASVLEQYDPNRSTRVIDATSGMGTPSNWQAFETAARAHFDGLRGDGGSIAVLCETSDSPSLQDMRQRFTQAFGGVQWFEYSPINRDNQNEGLRQAFGEAVRPRLHLEKADVVVSLDSDFLGPTHPASLRYGNDWVKRRKSAEQGNMSRVYVAESMLSITGTVADERLPLRPSELARVAAALASYFGGGQGSTEGLSEHVRTWVEHAAADLRHAGRAGVVIAGPSASPQVHVLAATINQALGAVGNTVVHLREPVQRPAATTAIQQFVDGIDKGTFTTVLIIGGNPAFDAPAELEIDKALAKAPLSIRLGLYEDETSALCKWHVPKAHYLEAWGDGRAWDGTITLQQPIILPLYDGKSAIELLAMIMKDEAVEGLQIVQRAAQAYLQGGDFESRWRKALHDGFVEGSALQAMGVQVRGGGNARAVDAAVAPDTLEVRFAPSYSLYDGRFAPNGWLLEMPDPLTKLVWDNAAIMNKADADARGLRDGTVITLDTGSGKAVDVAVFILPGQPRGVITLSLGWGRQFAGIGSGYGFNVYPIRTSNGMWGATVKNLIQPGRAHAMVTTQHHHMLDASGEYAFKERIGTQGHSGKIIREASLDEFKKKGRDAFKPEHYHETIELQLFPPPHEFADPHAWGMTIDMAACIGCSACVIACQAENNIPIVGKENVAVNREMHWLRIDRYFKGAGATTAERAADPNPEVVYQPMLCVHCENAPCEQVCPVAATVHDTEGLNTMVYNRCIGTRYCSNNCPYKVRRFNYFDWHSIDKRDNRFPLPWPFMPDSQQREQVDTIQRMVFNPGVTVRMRGVMEKCTYCTQRIWDAKIKAKNEALAGKRGQAEDATSKNPAENATLVRDWEVVTACQQSCPTEAIIFGNLNDPKAVVVGQQKSPRAYSVLEDLNTRPRTRHLALVRNPAIAKEAAEAPAHNVY